MKRFISNIFLIISAVALISCNDEINMPDNNSGYPGFSQIDFQASWSKDGNRIIFVHNDLFSDFTGIYKIDSNGDSNKMIMNAMANYPDFSPGGSHIVFTLNNSLNISTIDLDTSWVFGNSLNCSNPKWRSDGNWISFIGCNGSGCSLFIMKPDGSQKTIVDSNVSYANWTGMNNSLIYFKPIKNSAGIQNGDTLCEYLFTGIKKIIAVVQGDEHYINSFPCFAADAFIFCSLSKDGYSFVYRMNIDGSNLIKLTTTQSASPDFSQANQKIIYTNRNPGNGRLWKMNKDGTNKEQITP